MKILLVCAMALSLGACAARQVEVQTGAAASTATDAGVNFTNNLAQAVNVYVVTGTAGSDMFLRQVPGKGVEFLPVRGIASGATVSLKATTIDGQRTYTRDNVVLSKSTTWQVP